MPDRYSLSVADPGFPIGGRAPVRGGMDLRCGHFSVKMYAKMKELGPIGGRAPGTPPLDPPMVMIYVIFYFHVFCVNTDDN